MKKTLALVTALTFLVAPEAFAATDSGANRRVARAERRIQALIEQGRLTPVTTSADSRRLRRLNRRPQVTTPTEPRRITVTRPRRRTLITTSKRHRAREARRLRDERRQARSAKRDTFDNLRQEILRFTNIEREKAGLEPLTYNNLLERSAQLHAEDMAAQNYFSHNSPDGRNHDDRIKSTGYGDLNISTCNCRSFRVHYGENIAKGYLTPEEAVRGWMRSTGHRENLLKTVYGELGVGYVDSKKIWVQNFGSIKVKPK